MSDGIPPPLDSSARPWSPDPSSTPGRPLTPTKDLTPSSPLTDVVGRQSDALKGVSSTPPPLAPPTDEPELAADAGVTVEMEACSPSPPSSSAAEQPTSPRPDAAACQGGASDDASPAQLLHAPPRVELELAADARPAVCHGARALPLAQTHVEHHAPARTFALVVVPDACWPSGASESPGSLCWFACVSSSCGSSVRTATGCTWRRERSRAHPQRRGRGSTKKDGDVSYGKRETALHLSQSTHHSHRGVCCGLCVRNWCEKR